MADVCEILDVQPTSGSSNLDKSFKREKVYESIFNC